MIPNRHTTKFLFRNSYKQMILLVLLLSFFSGNTIKGQCTESAGILGTPQIYVSDNNVILKASFQEAPVVTEGYLNWFVLSKGKSRIIEQLGTQAAFEVSGEGLFTIHSLVFSPEEFDINQLKLGQTSATDLAELIQSTDGCSVFDFNGSAAEIYGPTNICGAFAGQLKADEAICMDDSLVQISASYYLPAIIPEGFQQLFLLSENDTAVITSYNESPEFVVPKAGQFAIHSFVYDTATFTLDSILFDTTTIAEIHALFQEGGGDICASLDTTGATIFPISCLPDCSVSAGTLLAGEQDCLTDGTKRIYATIEEPPTVPEGYFTTYLLTSGTDLLIRGLSNTPSFILEGEGSYTIHTLVYDTATLNPDLIILGQTKAGSILEQLIQGGGDICGALDVSGASMELGECPCLAAFGTLEPSDACLNENGTALEATVNTKAVVPKGYKQLFILSSGDDQIIEGFSNEPYFEIEQSGQFTIHNLVYNPGSLPLGWINFGTTSLPLLHSFLVQGGGDICAALDMEGAVFEVEECNSQLLTPLTFPNPVQDQLNIVIPSALDQKNVTIQLIDAFGNIAITKKSKQAMEQIGFDVSNLPEGFYSVRMLYGEGRVGISKIYISK